VSRLFDALERRDDAGAEALRDELVTRGSQSSKRLNQLEQHALRNVDLLLDRARAREISAIRLLVALAGLTALVGVAMALYARRVLKPLAQVTERAKAVASGDLKPRQAVASNDEIGELAATFEGMVSAIARANDELLATERLATIGKMAAHVTHEIRNPLSSIGHAAELLEEDHAMGEASKRLLDIISGNVTRLDRIVQQILDLNRRDRAQPEAIDANGFFANFVSQFAANEKVPEDNLDLQVRTTYRPWFDRMHLDQILWNLVRNAWRHGRRRPGSVRIVLMAASVPGRLTLDVIDDGMGVSREMQAHLFEPFFTSEAQGMGLGLYIARELCEGNGARIEYIDDSGGGHFRITMKGA
jgi:signal transduction histidine kinase